MLKCLMLSLYVFLLSVLLHNAQGGKEDISYLKVSDFCINLLIVVISGISILGIYQEL
jgi:hypothetical protein